MKRYVSFNFVLNDSDFDCLEKVFDVSLDSAFDVAKACSLFECHIESSPVLNDDDI